jgi:hypothetical protein
MKTIKLMFAIMLISTLSKAQITVTMNDLPQPGQGDIVATDTTTNINFGTASATPQNWNFSSLLNHYKNLAIYSPTAPYQQNAADFPDANIYTWGPAIFFSSFYGAAPVDLAGWGYMYWKTDISGFSIVGFRGNPGNGQQNVLEAPQELLMGTPASYDSTFTNSADWTVSINSNPFDVDTIFKCHIDKVLTCDAFGTLTTSFGTGPHNVIRVHEYVVEVDSVFAKLGPTTWPVYQLRDTTNNYHFWGKDIHYPLAIVHADKNNNVKNVEYLTDTLPVFQITGNVFRENGITSVRHGEASLFIKDSYNHLFTNLEKVAIDNNGNFQFASVLGPNFLVLADPDPTYYPYLLPTYYGDSTYWEKATTLNVFQDMNISINCQSDSTLAVLTGIGSINGTVWMDTTQVNKLSGPVNSNPARGVRVTLEQNPGGACRISHTNQNGYFEFNNLPEGNYKIKVDISGLVMDSTYHINLSAKSMTYNNLDFVYDTTFIYIIPNTGVNDLDGMPKYDISVFPNPFTDQATIHVENTTGENQELSLSIFDMTGRLVKQIVEREGDDILFTRDNMVKGMYIYELKVNEQPAGNGKVMVK